MSGWATKGLAHPAEFVFAGKHSESRSLQRTYAAPTDGFLRCVKALPRGYRKSLGSFCNFMGEVSQALGSFSIA